MLDDSFAAGLGRAIVFGTAMSALAGCAGVASQPVTPADPLAPPLAQLREPVPATVGPASLGPDVCPRGGVLYLSDQLSGSVTTWSQRGPHFRQLATTFVSGYGLGVAASHKPNPNGNEIYLAGLGGIDVFKPCSTKPAGPSYTGGGNKIAIAVAKDGTVYAVSFPDGTVYYWKAPGNPTGSAVIDGAYGIAVDRQLNVYISGWNPSFTEAQITRCDAHVSHCAVLATVASPSFPGGLAVDDAHHHLIVNNQQGTLVTLNLPSGTIAASFTYSNGTNPLDYVGIALSQSRQRLWAANTYLCSSSFGICGNAQSQAYNATSGVIGPLDGATLPDNHGGSAEPGAVAAYPPAAD